jgi:hypothetical protein
MTENKMQENAEVVALSHSSNRVFRFNTYWKGVVTFLLMFWR